MENLINPIKNITYYLLNNMNSRIATTSSTAYIYKSKNSLFYKHICRVTRFVYHNWMSLIKSAMRIEAQKFLEHEPKARTQSANLSKTYTCITCIQNLCISSKFNKEVGSCCKAYKFTENCSTLKSFQWWHILTSYVVYLYYYTQTSILTISHAFWIQFGSASIFRQHLSILSEADYIL